MPCMLYYEELVLFSVMVHGDVVAPEHGKKFALTPPCSDTRQNPNGEANQIFVRGSPAKPAGPTNLLVPKSTPDIAASKIPLVLSLSSFLASPPLSLSLSKSVSFFFSFFFSLNPN